MKQPKSEKKPAKRAGKIIGRIVLILMWIVLAAGLAVAAIRLVMVIRTAPNIYRTAEELPDQAPYDAVIVPGASVFRNRTPSPILKNRLDLAESLYKAGIAKTILVTGDHRPGEYDETDAMWEYLVTRNVPEEKILRDYKGFSTYESMVHAAETFGLKRVIVVTQGYHLTRALYIGASYGLEADGVIAENAGEQTGRVYRVIREWIASAKDFIYCLLKYQID